MQKIKDAVADLTRKLQFSRTCGERIIDVHRARLDLEVIVEKATWFSLSESDALGISACAKLCDDRDCDMIRNALCTTTAKFD